jgi:signal transduction histidine kinase
VRIFVAVPIVEGERVVGAVVVSRTPREEVEALFEMLPSGLFLGALASVVGAVALSLGAGTVVTRSLRAIAAESRQIADGTLASARLEGPRASSVAEVAEVAGAITALVDRLQDRLGYIAEFAGNVSHEFKTPLSTLRGTLELLADDPDMPADQRHRFVANATAEVLRLDHLVVGLLGLARADATGPAGPVDLDAILREVADRAGVPVEGTAGGVIGHADQLGLAAANLLENARRHGAPPIRLVAFREGGFAGFEVRDGGPGISAGNLPRVFDRFFTTDRAAGTGLGLALVAAIAKKSGGTVSVESRPGDTVFRLSLPQST